ncbi:MAG: ATP-binding protein [Rhodoferax sp.]|uniref:hybrid sensor histidine kinase/response regulator n=1 Tax=Rhodoferax sp. TaxID=50421 RepID=UPI002718B07F|nr:ATP-binding protein [Rhodoferax sp.]MDO8449044.1 ATP-binding protein [Rhodoferax sp.]
MKMVDIRSRMLLTALLPVTLLAVLLAAVFLVARVGDIGEAHSQRARTLARQLATASEYGLFSANITQLQTIASGALREPDVRSVAIVNAQGIMLVKAGQPRYTALPVLGGQESEKLDPATGTDLLSQPIAASQVKLDDLYESREAAAGTIAQPLGHVLIEFSRDRLVQRERDMLLAGVAVTLGGLLFGGFLAVRLGRGVIRPILRVSRMIEHIGRGELSARGAVLPDDPLRELQLGLNQMAERLESGRDELERRVVLATLELREKKEEAETATLAKSRFLAAASHDLRQPTHALGMFVARLAQLPHDAETAHLITNLDASVQAMQDLLDALLDISRLDARAVQVHRRPFALADIFDQLRLGLTATAVEKDLRLRVRPTNVWLLSDPTLLHRIMLNLVVNAVRYTRQGGVLVACRLARDGKHARIEVWDSGVGIAPEHHQAIFKEFYQVGNRERDRSKGLGLGLNIVERTAHLLGHRLQLRSSLGLGTRFSIEVPLAPPGAPALPNPFEARTLDDLADLVVLVIEDDALAREGLVSLLESWGVVVVVAEGVSTALWQLKFGVVPDVIISDYRLRDTENGLDTVRQLRAAAGQQIPACLMSGDTDPALMQAARIAGLTLLHKPVRPAKLRSLIRRLAAGEPDGVQLAGAPASRPHQADGADLV